MTLLRGVFTSLWFRSFLASSVRDHNAVSPRRSRDQGIVSALNELQGVRLAFPVLGDTGYCFAAICFGDHKCQPLPGYRNMELEGELVVGPANLDKFGRVSHLEEVQCPLGCPHLYSSTVSVVHDLETFYPRPVTPPVGVEIHVYECVAFTVEASVKEDLEITEEIPLPPLLVRELGNRLIDIKHLPMGVHEPHG